MFKIKGINVAELEKYFELTGELAMIDAKAHKSYIVYKDAEGQLIKEHYDGRIEIIDKNDIEE